MKKKNILSLIDKPLFIAMIIYSCIGMLLVLSSSSVSAVVRYNVSPYYFFIKQLISIVGSFLIGFIFILRTSINKYKILVPIALIGIIVLLVVLLIYGQMVNSARSWIDLGFFSVQPSEFSKLILILYLGIFFGNEIKREGNNNYRLIKALTPCALLIGLIAIQPDMGTAIIVGSIVFLTFIAIPFNKESKAFIIKIIGGSAIILGLIFLLTSSSFLNNMQSSRLEYKNPCSRYTKDTGYQVCNGFIAMHNGGLWGVGIGKSTQKYLYLPEAHTDFAFAILVEEVGAVIGSLVILGYIFIVYRIFVIAKKCYNIRDSIICYGVAMIFIIHLLVNFLGILALIPLTGVPLPFLSYGGSFTITIIFSLFIVQRIAIESKMTKKKIEISKITGK